MNLSQMTTSEQANKRYIYRYYSWNLIIVLLLIHGFITFVFTWLAITSKQVGNSFWFFALVFFTVFLYYGWLAFLDIRNIFVIGVSQTGIYLPAIWKQGTTVYLPFSSVTAIELIKVRNNKLLKFSVGKKIYVVIEKFFPQRKDFAELIGIVQKQPQILFSDSSKGT